MPYDLGEDFPVEITGPRMTTSESKKQLFMTYQNEIYYFKCRSREDCYWEQKNYQLQIKRSFHVTCKTSLKIGYVCLYLNFDPMLTLNLALVYEG